MEMVSGSHGNTTEAPLVCKDAFPDSPRPQASPPLPPPLLCSSHLHRTGILARMPPLHHVPHWRTFSVYGFCKTISGAIVAGVPQ